MKDQPRVLVVDHDELVCHVLLTRLEREGIMADCAGDPEEFLRLCRETRYDIVVVDLATPGITESKVSRTFGTQAKRPPIVALGSSSASLADLDGAVVPFIIGKPFDFTMLTDVIVECAREYRRLIA